MNGTDGKRPKIRPGVSHKYDGSTYYEYLEARMRERQQATPATAQQPLSPTGTGAFTAAGPAQTAPAKPAHAPAGSAPIPPAAGQQAGYAIPTDVAGQSGYGQAAPGAAWTAQHPHTQTVPTQTAPEQAPYPPAPRRRRPWLLVLSSLAALIVIALIAVLGFQALGPTGGVEETAGGSPENANASAPVTDAGTELGRLADESRSYLQEKVDGKWVAQLSAKQEGLETPGGQTWDAESILAEHNALEQQYGATVLIRSSEWSSFQLGGYWVTALETPFDSADQALAKCRELGRDRDSCFAKRVSSTDSPDGSTVLNP